MAAAIKDWALQLSAHIHYIEPRKPNLNAYSERVIESSRTEVLDALVFALLDNLLDVSEHWRRAYNTERSHEILGRVPSLTYLPRRTIAPYPTDFKLCA